MRVLKVDFLRLVDIGIFSVREMCACFFFRMDPHALTPVQPSLFFLNPYENCTSIFALFQAFEFPHVYQSSFLSSSRHMYFHSSWMLTLTLPKPITPYLPCFQVPTRVLMRVKVKHVWNPRRVKMCVLRTMWNYFQYVGTRKPGTRASNMFQESTISNQEDITTPSDAISTKQRDWPALEKFYTTAFLLQNNDQFA